MDEGWLREQLALVMDRIERARLRAGRSESIELVAVTKGHPASTVRAASAVGLGRCGENRVDELERKVGEVGRDAVEWHLIGHLQRNKARRALPLFDLIHSIDSPRLAQELSKEGVRQGLTVRGLIQVNVSGEVSKGGFNALSDPGPVIDQVAAVSALPALDVLGLMTMAPLTDDESVLRRTFGRARELFDRCGREIGGFRARHLSMGMTNDFEVAVEEGSTMLRLGTILFGERQP
jgi:pyridoxal phosphate enzyme (YggS family)